MFGKISVSLQRANRQGELAGRETQHDVGGAASKPAGKKGTYSVDTTLNAQNLDIRLSVERYQLKNGLTVLLHPDSRIPYIHHLFMVRVGSGDEEPGKTGLAHLFEHMMFRGTKRFPGEEYDNKINAMGAENNAYTSRDLTGYYVYLPRQHLETVLDMESDRLQNLIITKEVFEKELEVVKEERRMRTDNHPGDVFEPMMKLVFPVHPYGRPILGWMKDLEAMKVPDLKQFYHRYYAPDKTVLMLAGDFDVSKAKKLIQKYYSPLKPSPSPKKNKTPSSLSTKTKHFVRYKRAIQGPTLAFGFEVPPSSHPGAYDLDILSHILTEGESSRLKKLLVRDTRMALQVYSFYYGLKRKGVFLIIVRMVPGVSVTQVQKLVFNELKKLVFQPVEEKEMLKSKRAISHTFISAVKSLHGKANVLVENELLFGDYKEFFRDLNRYYKVTPPGIHKTVQQYLKKEQAFIVELMPRQKQTNASKKAL